jgi:hypothetical protein
MERFTNYSMLLWMEFVFQSLALSPIINLNEHEQIRDCLIFCIEIDLRKPDNIIEELYSILLTTVVNDTLSLLLSRIWMQGIYGVEHPLQYSSPIFFISTLYLLPVH